MNDASPLFTLGNVVCTPGALSALQAVHVSEAILLARHRCGDFGQVTAEEAERNLHALWRGGRIMSSFRLSEHRTVWVITEADRSATTLLLPDEHDRACGARYELRFRSLFREGRALVFPCDPCGRVDLDSLSERARQNYLYARALAGRDFAAPAVEPVAE